MPAWETIDTEEVTGPDDKRWEIDLLTGETRFVSQRPRAASLKLSGVKASANWDDDHQFAVVAWVASPRVDAAKTAVMKEARRRIAQGDWSPAGEYELR